MNKLMVVFKMDFIISLVYQKMRSQMAMLFSMR